MKDVETEVLPTTEWVLYDDDLLKFVPGNWAEIVYVMSQTNAYPTVLLYEKLEVTDQYNGDSFKIDDIDLHRIV